MTSRDGDSLLGWQWEGSGWEVGWWEGVGRRLAKKKDDGGTMPDDSPEEAGLLKLMKRLQSKLITFYIVIGSGAVLVVALTAYWKYRANSRYYREQGLTEVGAPRSRHLSQRMPLYLLLHNSCRYGCHR